MYLGTTKIVKKINIQRKADTVDNENEFRGDIIELKKQNKFTQRVGFLYTRSD